jgi:hypothetical protein
MKRLTVVQCWLTQVKEPDEKSSSSYGQNGQLVPLVGAGLLWPGVRTSWTVEILNCSRPLFQDLTNQDLDTAELESAATKAFALRCVRLPFSFPLWHRSCGGRRFIIIFFFFFLFGSVSTVFHHSRNPIHNRYVPHSSCPLTSCLFWCLEWTATSQFRVGFFVAPVSYFQVYVQWHSLPSLLAPLEVLFVLFVV